MAFNPKSEVAAARDFATRFGADRVVIFYTTPQGQFGCASYGRNKRLCDQARKMGDVTNDALYQWFENGGLE